MTLEYSNVNIYYEEKCVLQNINMKAEEGELIYITGKTGAGKSSLLKTIYGELDIKEADVSEVLGRNIQKIKRKEIPNLRKEMGIIFQDFQLLNDRNVYENLFFVLKSTGWKDKKLIQEKIEEVLTLTGMEHNINKMPYKLSGGEQQRAAIARAFLNSPKMIIADEPTGNLDHETASHIAKLLSNISKKGTTVIITTHNTNIINENPGTIYICKEQTLIKHSQITND